MDDESQRLAVLENEVNEHLSPTVERLEDDVKKQGLWIKLAAWTVFLVGGINTPIGKKLVNFFSE